MTAQGCVEKHKRWNGTPFIFIENYIFYAQIIIY